MNAHSFFLMAAVTLVSAGVASSAGAADEGALMPEDERFAVHEHPYAQIRVDGFARPVRVEGHEVGRCVVLLGVNSKGEQTAWPQDCAEDLARASVASAAEWSYAPGEVGPGEIYARFHAVFVFPEGEDPFVQIPWRILTESPNRYPTGLVARSEVQIRHRHVVEIKPSLREAYPGPRKCSARVLVSAKGLPKAITEVECPEEWTLVWVKSLRKWRWERLLENGVPFESSTTVTVSFR